MRSFYINEAAKMAEKSIMRCSCHGAVVITRGKIVGRGFNQYREIVNKRKVLSIHAEVSAIQNALRNITLEELSQSTLVIVRVNKQGDIIYSYPCENCRKFIHEKKLKTVYYS
jgi:cytidine deaminase